MHSLNRVMKSVGLVTGGLFSVSKMLGRGGVSGSGEGRFRVLRLREAKSLEFWKSLYVDLLVVWSVVEGGRSEGGLPDTLKREYMIYG